MPILGLSSGLSLGYPWVHPGPILRPSIGLSSAKTRNTSDHAEAPALQRGREGEEEAAQRLREGRAKRRRFERPSKVEWP